jgi:formylglycine-generating enzyme required for sulfatase activity
MLGNVSEWCYDVYLPVSNSVLQRVFMSGALKRVRLSVRGGDYHSNARMLRAANRRFALAAESAYGRGFRIACSLKSVDESR